MTTSFADALAQSKRHTSTRCSFATLRSKLKPKDLEQLDNALASSMTDLPHSQIARALTLVTGSKVDADIVGRHRRGECRQCAGA